MDRPEKGRMKIEKLLNKKAEKKKRGDIQYLQEPTWKVECGLARCAMSKNEGCG